MNDNFTISKMQDYIKKSNKLLIIN